MIEKYDSPHQFEPLMPSEVRLEPLLALAHELTVESTGVTGIPIAQELGALLRAMNSYFTNRIEGQHTRPRELEQALRQDFSADAKLAARQRLAVAHIAAEEQLETEFAGQTAVSSLYSKQALLEIHRVLFEKLPPSDLLTEHGTPIQPGVMRTLDVSVGRHAAPTASSLDAFIGRWSDVYGHTRRGEATIVAMAASHHRIGWVHPFVDGNGRVMRLHTHLILNALGYSAGVWSPLRGFARSVDRYYALLDAADAPRKGDLDGRGNLSESALVDWIQYVLEMCLDQVRFMKSMLNLSTMEQRIAACLVFEQESLKSGVRLEALRPLHYLFLSGTELERGEFKRMTGLGDRTAVTLLTALVKRGLLKSDSPQGKVRFGLPLHALRFYFPALWPEAEADALV
ncbi:MAG: Fic family protein [Burkholderiales bacterium]|nr:Fic family protein [Burkholderiales bacterium]